MTPPGYIQILMKHADPFQNLKKINKLIWLALGFVLTFVLFISVINFDTNRTAYKYCILDRGGEQYCQKFYKEESDQLAPSINPKHLFLSDLAFRNVFESFGYRTGTSITFDTDYHPWPQHVNGSAEDKAEYGTEQRERVKLVHSYRQRLLLYFTLFIIAETVIISTMILRRNRQHND